ncbi:MAG TPA: 5-methyltetrahydropteroyltriglutamate--homocysteine S-methyltransferase, partial [Anseongella sp.]|nr:5-methyltetrahydropteroyltriglutamate--homocysteine S-methyltransferase [Anseongella sp.]
MKTHLLGFPRIGARREIKKACERYWSGKASFPELAGEGKKQRRYNWRLQQEAGIDLIPCNDFSFYDQVLDMSVTVGAVPARYRSLEGLSETDLYFAMARGCQQDGLDVTAMEMTKWFDTNYHYIVPEFTTRQQFSLHPGKALGEFSEAAGMGISPKPVIIGPVSYLLLGKEKEAGFHRLDLLDNLLPVYRALLLSLKQAGAEWVQLDEPFLTCSPGQREKNAFRTAYAYLKSEVPQIKLLAATYFEGLHESTELACSLGLDALHIDLVRAPGQLDKVLDLLPSSMILSVGVVDGRNIWKNDLSRSLGLVSRALDQLKEDSRLWIAPSCSLLHVPFDLDLEPAGGPLPEEVKKWTAFARQKVQEVVSIARLASPRTRAGHSRDLKANILCMEERRKSPLVRNQAVQRRLSLQEGMPARN